VPASLATRLGPVSSHGPWSISSFTFYITTHIPTYSLLSFTLSHTQHTYSNTSSLSFRLSGSLPAVRSFASSPGSRPLVSPARSPFVSPARSRPSARSPRLLAPVRWSLRLAPVRWSLRLALGRPLVRLVSRPPSVGLSVRLPCGSPFHPWLRRPLCYA